MVFKHPNNRENLEIPNSPTRPLRLRAPIILSYIFDANSGNHKFKVLSLPNSSPSLLDYKH